MKISILGAGSFGTAMANHLAKLGNDILIWTIDGHQADSINDTGYNPLRFKDVKLSDKIHATLSLEETLVFSEHVIAAIPTQAVREVLEKVAAAGKGGRHLLNLAKGIEIRSGKLLHQIYQEACPECTYSTLSGPSHAEEIIEELPTAVALASFAKGEAEKWQQIITGNSFRIYTSDDVVGLEVGGATKNIYAIAAGIAKAMGLGDNATAALVCRGLAEIMRLGGKMGASPMTLSGLAGVGDLLVTCYSMHSRNFRLGFAIGAGKNFDEAVDSLGEVAEGAYTVRAVIENSKDFNVELPIAEGVYRILYQGESPQEIVRELLLRPLKSESEGWRSPCR